MVQWGVEPCGALGFCLVTIKSVGLLIYEFRLPVDLSCWWLIDHSMMTACFFSFPPFPVVPWGVPWSAGVLFRDLMTIKPGLGLLLYDVPLFWVAWQVLTATKDKGSCNHQENCQSEQSFLANNQIVPVTLFCRLKNGRFLRPC